MKLYHATNPRNRKNIKLIGLVRNRPHSGYGKTPEHNAIYLYYINNVDVPCDLIQIFGGKVDIWEVTNLDESKLIPDEDSGKNTWKESIQEMGTCAYLGDIPTENLRFVGSFRSEDEYIAWVSLEKLMNK